MAIQRTFFGLAKSILGTTLVGLGISNLYEKLDWTIAQLNHCLGTIPWRALGVLPSIILATSRVLQAMPLITSGFCRVSYSTCCYRPGRCCSSWLERYCRGRLSRTMSTHF